ncbi:MAG: glycosyltransferase family 4 protein [Patescibacteria group bacterium]|jgi:glycosyltransferase involved in cell wall biosynthesis
MNLLVINLDKAIFSENSASLARLKEYSRLADKISVIVWTKNKFAPIVYENKLFVYPTNSCCRLFYFFDSFRLAKKIIARDKIDLLFTQDPFETGLAGWLIAKINKIKLQLQIHTDLFSPYFRRQSLANRFRVMLAEFLISRADGFRVVSGRIKNSLIRRGVKEDKIFVLPIFTEVEKFIAAPAGDNLKNKYPQFEKIILMASRLSREKNIGLAVKAMAEVIKKYPRAGLIIAGAGKERKFLKKIGRKFLGGNIAFEPWAGDLASYYKSADVFLLSSNYEGWGMSIVEALAAGCPIVMTDVGCAGELVRDGENGLVVPVGDSQALANAIKKILSDENSRRNFKAAGLAAVKSLPGKQEYLNGYKKSWEALL